MAAGDSDSERSFCSDEDEQFEKDSEAEGADSRHLPPATQAHCSMISERSDCSTTPVLLPRLPPADSRPSTRGRPASRGTAASVLPAATGVTPAAKHDSVVQLDSRVFEPVHASVVVDSPVKVSAPSTSKIVSEVKPVLEGEFSSVNHGAKSGSGVASVSSLATGKAPANSQLSGGTDIILMPANVAAAPALTLDGDSFAEQTSLAKGGSVAAQVNSRSMGTPPAKTESQVDDSSEFESDSSRPNVKETSAANHENDFESDSDVSDTESKSPSVSQDLAEALETVGNPMLREVSSTALTESSRGPPISASTQLALELKTVTRLQSSASSEVVAHMVVGAFDVPGVENNANIIDDSEDFESDGDVSDTESSSPSMSQDLAKGEDMTARSLSGQVNCTTMTENMTRTPVSASSQNALELERVPELNSHYSSRLNAEETSESCHEKDFGSDSDLSDIEIKSTLLAQDPAQAVETIGNPTVRELSSTLLTESSSGPPFSASTKHALELKTVTKVQSSASSEVAAHTVVDASVVVGVEKNAHVIRGSEDFESDDDVSDNERFVPSMSQGLAEAVDMTSSYPFGQVNFTPPTEKFIVPLVSSSSQKPPELEPVQDMESHDRGVGALDIGMIARNAEMVSDPNGLVAITGTPQLEEASFSRRAFANHTDALLHKVRCDLDVQNISPGVDSQSSQCPVVIASVPQLASDLPRSPERELQTCFSPVPSSKFTYSQLSSARSSEFSSGFVGEAVNNCFYAACNAEGSREVFPPVCLAPFKDELSTLLVPSGTHPRPPRTQSGAPSPPLDFAAFTAEGSIEDDLLYQLPRRCKCGVCASCQCVEMERQASRVSALEQTLLSVSALDQTLWPLNYKSAHSSTRQRLSRHPLPIQRPFCPEEALLLPVLSQKPRRSRGSPPRRVPSRKFRDIEKLYLRSAAMLLNPQPPMSRPPDIHVRPKRMTGHLTFRSMAGSGESMSVFRTTADCFAALWNDTHDDRFVPQ